MKEGNKTDETGKETVKRVFDNKEIINRGSHFYSLTSPLMTELQFDRLETIGDITCTREDFMEASGILNNPEINIYETIDAILHEEAPGKKNDGLKKILKIARRFATINNIKP